MKHALKRYWPLMLGIPMVALLCGCEVNDNRADDQMPIWYPSFIYHGAAPDVNDAGVNGGSNQSDSNTTTDPAGMDPGNG